MTMETDSVFTSDITRGCVPNTKDLYSLINIIPAIPIKQHHEPTKEINFQPKSGKFYVPKRKSKLKVKTVRNIRSYYENDVLSILPQELEKQHNYLLRRIKKGSSQNEATKFYAKNILNSDKPISRLSWQMLMNVNPDNKLHPIQYVLWNGVPLRLNGGKGGKTKFLYKYDLQRNMQLKVFPKQQKKHLENKYRKKLLENSVNVKFKPGPLSKKRDLDESYQKHQVGSIELVKLPTPVLEIGPTNYGIPFAASTRSVLNSLRDINGEISENWAALATTALGSYKSGKLEKIHPDACISFELSYKNYQKKILMRQNCYESLTPQQFDVKQSLDHNHDDIVSEVKNVITAMLDSVEISLQQDILSYDQDDIREIPSNASIITNTKEKTKKKFAELSRLDVTVIELPYETPEGNNIKCEKLFCKLGCICVSLECRKSLRGHCGRLRCMFSCKCDLSTYNIDDNHTEILNELVSLDKQICSKLSKEEQKFHQTVVLSGEQSIVLKSKRRDCKAPKKYHDFYSNFKNKEASLKRLSVAALKLNCKNIEPWCMVHHLYKCFCGGKFVDSVLRINEDTTQEIVVYEEKLKLTDTPLNRERRNTVIEKAKSDIKTNDFVESVPIYSIDQEISSDFFEDYPESYQCSRLMPYEHRKYDDAYYNATNFKIRAMERNDKTIHNKLMSLVFKGDKTIESPVTKQICLEIKKRKISSSEKKNSHNEKEKDIPVCNKADTPPPSIYVTDSEPETSSEKQESPAKKICNVANSLTLNSKDTKSNLIQWLENSYKLYKKRLDEGIVKNSLDPPKHGIMALYPWEFLLTRYRESKNLFLVTNTRPYRIFMAVSMKHPFFKNCINIDDIRFTDLHQYPTTIKNLLTNVNNLVDHFYIFRGLSFCWELIGSVSKINEKDTEIQHENNDLEELEEGDSRLTLETDDKEGPDCSSSVEFKNIILSDDAENNTIQTPLTESNDSSKWFVMTLENDFSEIQFYKKGFFVKYESIIKAIQLARVSGNTVRLSSQKCLDQITVPPFGIYAIPSTEKCSVFIGPYEKDEPLGIETVKIVIDNKKNKRTRGVWITTNKIDNMKVIEKPFAFIPETNTNQMVQLYDDELTRDSKTPDPPADKSVLTQNLNTESSVMAEHSSITTASDATSPVVSPGHLNSAPKKVTIKTYVNNRDIFLKRTRPTSVENKSIDAGTSNQRSNEVKSKPIAEIAPQIKSIPESQNNESVCRKAGIGMFILKPEEINKKAMANQIIVQNSLIKDNVSEEMSTDIEKFLATSVVCAAPNTLNLLDVNEDECSDVWIECVTVNSLGWISGKRRSDGFLSIGFPGFKESPFYEEEEAFVKLNQVFERKVFVPKDMCLKWRVVTNKEDLHRKLCLKPEHLGPDFILTKRGLRHKRAFFAGTSKTQGIKSNRTQVNLFEGNEEDLEIVKE